MSQKKRTPNKSLRRLLITTGDQDGIGLEVATKALRHVGPKTGVQFIVFKNSAQNSFFKRALSKQFEIRTCGSLAEALTMPSQHDLLIEIASSETEPSWIFEAARSCMAGTSIGMVTGPLSKTLIKRCGYKEMGHTEILKSVSGQSDLFMGFVGAQFSVILATGHIPILRIPSELTSALIEKATRVAIQMRKGLKNSKSIIKILGLNPHAGEGGMLGRDEMELIIPVIDKLAKEGHTIVGPVVPDTAFTSQNLKSPTIFVCMYHDQGLIPFKTVHGFDEGYHITLGLPFIRTSVDHGTAKDIFGKNKANPGSMIAALKGAIELTSRLDILKRKS